jgi:hypothetical protein
MSNLKQQLILSLAMEPEKPKVKNSGIYATGKDLEKAIAEYRKRKGLDNHAES